MPTHAGQNAGKGEKKTYSLVVAVQTDTATMEINVDGPQKSENQSTRRSS